MSIPYSEPDPAGSERARIAKRLRDFATEVARLRPQALTETNREEADLGPQYPASFTKGLKHDDCGLVAHADDYHWFVEAINSPDRTLFEKRVETAETRGVSYHCSSKETCHGKETVKWRGWESPRAGHAFDLEVDAAIATESQLYKRIAFDLIFHSPQLQQVEFKRGYILEKLFNAFREHYIDQTEKKLHILPAHINVLIEQEPTGKRRLRRLCDFISGLTDSLAVRTYKRLYDPDMSLITELL